MLFSSRASELQNQQQRIVVVVASPQIATTQIGQTNISHAC